MEFVLFAANGSSAVKWKPIILCLGAREALLILRMVLCGVKIVIKTIMRNLENQSFGAGFFYAVLLGPLWVDIPEINLAFRKFLDKSV